MRHFIVLFCECEDYVKFTFVFFEWQQKTVQKMIVDFYKSYKYF